jgi:hypothetical protein
MSGSEYGEADWHNAALQMAVLQIQNISPAQDPLVVPHQGNSSCYEGVKV